MLRQYHAPPALAPHKCSIGAPESTLELECRFDSLAELEGFWSAIPQQQHKVRLYFDVMGLPHEVGQGAASTA